PEAAPMARVFEALAVPFTRQDLSPSALPVLRARQFAARGLRGTLEREGHRLLSSALVEESVQIAPLLDAGRLRRTLYRAVKPK
ncbi:MAG: hypothetical protein AAFY88_11400, partial [Acidobacteriota bacterium]